MGSSSGLYGSNLSDWDLSHMEVPAVGQTPRLEPTIYLDDGFSIFGMLYPGSTGLPTVDDATRQAEKAAKQKKLWEMKEATRLLEEELAASLVSYLHFLNNSFA